MATRTPRVRVQTTDANIRTGIHAPQIGSLPVDDSAVRQAAALQNALGVAANAYEQVTNRRHAKAHLAGSKAALEGRELTEQERKRDSFMMGVESIRTERTLADLEAKARELYQTSANREDPVAFQAELDALYKGVFGGLDPEVDLDRAIYRQASIGWRGIVEKLGAQQRADATQRIQDGIEDDVIQLAGKEFADTGEIDWQALNDRALPLVGSERANDLVYAIARDLAEKHGRPELLDSIPNSWSNHAASPKSIQRYMDGLRNSRLAAEAQRARLDKAEEAQAIDEMRVAREAAEITTMQTILGGGSALADVQRGLDNGTIEPDTARTLLNFEKAFADAAGGDNAPRWDEVAALELQLLTGELVGNDATAAIKQAVESGALGSGKQLAQNVEKLFTQQRTVESHRRNSLEYQASEAMIKATFPVVTGGLVPPSSQKIEQMQMRQARALRRFNDLVNAGTSPTEAERMVLSEQHIPAMAAANQLDPAAAARTGDLATFLNALPAGANPAEALADLAMTGGINDATAEALIAALDARAAAQE